MAKYDLAKEMIRNVLENKQTNEFQRKEAYDLLSKIFIIEQKQKEGIRKAKEIERKIKMRRTEKGIKIKKGSEEGIVIKKRPDQEGRYGIQVGAFSKKSKAEKMIERLKKLGFHNVFISESSGIYKVILGKFKTRKEAKEKLKILRKINIYGFIVDME